jgi:hypothetical protein
MKPTPITNQNGKKFPLVDYHYHATTLGGSSGRCVKPSKSLRDISRDYFDREANEHFISEAALFTTLILTVVVPIISSASAMVGLLRTLPF